MQDRTRLFHTPLGHSENIMDDLISPNPEVRNAAAAVYRKWIERNYQNADIQEYSKISNDMFLLFTRMSRSNDENVQLGFLALVNELVDLGYQEEERNVRISQYLGSLIKDIHLDSLLNPLANTVGHLLRVGSSYLSEFIDSILTESLQVVSSPKDTNRTIVSLLFLKEIADNSPTHFYQKIQSFQDHILQLLKNKNIRVRIVAGEALSSCLLLMQQRENQKKNDFYYKFLGLIQDLPKDNRNESIHGYLIAINSFLNNSMEFCSSSMDSIYSLIRSYFNTKESYIKESIIRIIPVITKFMNRYADSFLTKEYRIEIFEYLMSCTHRENFRGEALKAIGQLALVLPDDTVNRLDDICNVIKECLNSKKKTRYPCVKEALDCFTNLSCALKERFTDRITRLCNDLFAAGISEDLIDALKELSKHTQDSLDIVQERLLGELSKVLCGEEDFMQPNPPSFTSKKNKDGMFVPDMVSVELALKTLTTFELKKRCLYDFICRCVLPYVDDVNTKIRCLAVKVTCKLLLPSDPNEKHYASFLQEYEVVQRLISVGLADRDSSVRSCLLNSLDERFDPYLIQSENVSFLLLGLHDEKYEIQRAVLLIIGRLSSSIPGVVTNAVRQLILDLLRSLEYSKESETVIESVKLLGLAIHSTSSLIEAYVNPVFEILVNRLKDIQQESVRIAFIDTLSLLSEVGTPELKKYYDVLMPLIIDYLKHNNELREAALGLLTSYSYCTGYVIRPFLEYSSLMDILLNQHNKSANSSYTLNDRVMRCFGVLGAIDPFVYNNNIKQLTEKNDQLVSYEDLQQEQRPLLCRLSERNLIVTLEALMSVFVDDTYSASHHHVISSLRMVINKMNNATFPYLSLVVPPFIRTMEKHCDSSHFQQIACFFIDLVQMVKEHIRVYLPDILKAMRPFWSTNQNIILRFIRNCSACFHGEFKLYLVYVLPQMLSILAEDNPERKTNTTEIIHCLLNIVPSLDGHLNVVLPSLLRFIENSQRFYNHQLEGVKCLRRIVHELDVSLYTSQIIMPLLRILSNDYCDVVPEIMDVICAVISQKQQEAYIYLSAINKVVAEKKIIYPRFNEISNALYRGGVLPIMEYVFDKKDDSVDFMNERLQPPPYNDDITHLQSIWRQVVNITMKEDWLDWNRRFAISLIRESPDPSFRSCSSLAQSIQPFAAELFNAAFTTLWNELSPANRADLASCFKQAFESPQVPPEIIMQLLSLGEFMEHDEDVVLQMSKDIVLPLDIRILGNLAISSNAYAKALHYKEMEYETTPDTCIEKLIQINNQLHLNDAAVGVLRYSQKYHADVTEVKDELYEKLGRWEEALEAYERKQLSIPIQTELTMGRIRCLNALGESEVVLRVIKQAEDKLADSGQAETVAVFASKAAFDIGDWDGLKHYLSNANGNSPGVSFYKAALYIHEGEYDLAEELIAEARATIGRQLAPIMGEGYSRVYSYFIQLEKLEELEEICRLQKRYSVHDPHYMKAREHLISIFDNRLEGVQCDVSVWHDLLSLRKLFVQIGECSNEGIPYSRDYWLKFISLSRKSNRPALALRTLSSLGIHIKPAGVLGENTNDELDAPAEVRYAYQKFLYDQGQTTNAIQRLRRLVMETNRVDLPKPEVYNHGSSLFSLKQEERRLEVTNSVNVRIRLRLAQWELEANHKNLSDEVVNQITEIIHDCSRFNEENHRAYHKIAMLHMTCAEHYHSNHSHEKVTEHLQDAIRNFFDAISLSTDKNSSLVLQDILRIITLWFTYGNREEVINAINRGFNIISLDTWLYVIPQLVARIHIEDSSAKRLLISLLIQLSKAHPQALVYPLTRSTRSATESRKRAAQEVLSHLRRDNSVLVKEADTISSEMIRVAVLWTEKWMRAIEDASKQYYEMKNIKKMLQIIDELYKMCGPSETQNEDNFNRTYERQMESTREYLLRYMTSSNVNDIESAWKNLTDMHKRLQKAVKVVTELELDSVSPKLLNIKNPSIAVPGMYSPENRLNFVRIRQFYRILAVLPSKQRPRKIIIIGSDNNKYAFLLKGNEDLRQDERVMQFFTMVNRLLAVNPETCKQELFVRTYSVTPLSDNCGVVSWVDRHDTLHSLIRLYRESKHADMSAEYTLIKRFAPMYEDMAVIKRVEIFDAVMNETIGDDLKSLLWLRSKNSEKWLLHRINYTRSLAVMSMVGYILGLGDRHPSNIMIDRISGSICHIDFGDCFEVTMQREKFPEKIPFRLTRMLVKAMEVGGVEGTFRSTCESVMSVMRQNEDSLMAILEAFVHDPLMNWKLLEKGSESDRDVDLKEDMENDELSSSVNHTNEKATSVISRVRDKLTGNDFYEDEKISVAEQVRRLIIQATSRYNLSQCYIGWCPFY